MLECALDYDEYSTRASRSNTGTSQRGLTSPTRSTNDMMAGLRRRNTDKPKRRRSDSTTTSSTPSKRDLTKPMMELQRINKARRLLEDVKRIAENWIYMLKQVEEQESIFTAELMERLDDDSDDLSDSESSKNAPTLERPKSGTWCSSAKRENFNHITQILRVLLYHSLVSLHTR